MFVAVLEVGSFAGAAARLGTSSGRVKAGVASEQQLGVQLFKRSTRALSPTEIGRAYYERVKTLLEAFDALDATVQENARSPTGRLKISAPGTFGTAVLASVLVAFARHYPLIELDVNFSDRAVNIVDEGFDMAIRIGKLDDSSLIARRLGEVPIRLAAAPAICCSTARRSTGAIWRRISASATPTFAIPALAVRYAVWRQRQHADSRPPVLLQHRSLPAGGAGRPRHCASAGFIAAPALQRAKSSRCWRTLRRQPWACLLCIRPRAIWRRKPAC